MVSHPSRKQRGKEWGTHIYQRVKGGAPGAAKIGCSVKLREGAIEVDVAPVDNEVLTGGVTGLRGRQEKDDCCGDLG